MVHVQTAHMMNIYQLADTAKVNKGMLDTSAFVHVGISKSLLNVHTLHTFNREHIQVPN